MSHQHYTYTHTVTHATTGYFSCEPPANYTLENALRDIVGSPYDDFLHNYALRALCALPAPAVASYVPQAAAAGQVLHKPLAALLLECALLRPAVHSGLIAALGLALNAPADATSLAALLHQGSPLIYLRWLCLPDREAHSAWAGLFTENIGEHRLLPHPEDSDLPWLYSKEALCALAQQDPALAAALPTTWQGYAPAPRLADIHAAMLAEPASTPWQRPPAQETAQKALSALIEHGIVGGQEMRHEASLSPIALLRPWNVAVAVHNGTLEYSLQGQATTYGRGLSLAGTRASYAMEMVERASSYVSIETQAGQSFVTGRTSPMPLVLARFSELQAQGRAALDPDNLPLEVPYSDFPLHWLEARNAAGEAVLVPAQAVFLFCNLDEPALFMAGGSTGLASGNTEAEAKVAALTEIFERDAEALTLYRRSLCFTVRSRDPRLQALLDDYAARGIQVQFMNLTTVFGLPCYQCFVRRPEGGVARATAAKLSGMAAALAALTETPYPYPHGQPSAGGLRGLPVRMLEDLPDYTLESPERNVAMLERLLAAYGRQVYYVSLTRSDLGLPVVRALVPKMELTAERDAFSRVPARLFANYVRCAF